ncbi:unnamed protein product [Owenia fusiformis]|uniref:Uncharacterized protein n=1 Tax=Owenia fusiformis TaxID=6347 RepID=A0A8S4NKT3_OWEFU|nr:unnamed protein product [Owenia fusiformis]
MDLSYLYLLQILYMLYICVESRIGHPCTERLDCWCNECCVFDGSSKVSTRNGTRQGTCKLLKVLNEECLLDQSKRLERNVAYECPCGKGYKCTPVGATERRYFYIGKKKLQSGIGLCKPQFCVNSNDCGQTQCCIKLFGVKLPYLSKIPRANRKAVGRCTELSKERQVCLKSANIRNNRAAYDQYCPCKRDLVCDDAKGALWTRFGFNPITLHGECKKNKCTKQKDCLKDECCVLDKEQYEKTGVVSEEGTCRQLGKCGEACMVGVFKPLQETKPMFVDCPCKEQQYTCRPLNPKKKDKIGAPGTCQRWSEEEREIMRLEEERKQLLKELRNSTASNATTS